MVLLSVLYFSNITFWKKYAKLDPIKFVSFHSIGPGEYKAKSDFDLNKYVREMDERGTYLTIDNGHLN